MKAFLAFAIGWSVAGLLGWASNAAAHHTQDVSGFPFLWWCAMSIILAAAMVFMAIIGIAAAADSK